MKSILTSVALGLALVCCTSREPESAPAAAPRAPETSAEARIDQATQACLSPKENDDCQHGAQVLATLIVELADDAEVPVDFDKEMDEVQEQLQTGTLSDPALTESLLVAYKLVNDNQDFQRPTHGSQEEILLAFRSRTGAAREALHGGRKKECIKELLAGLLLLARPVQAG